MTLSENLLDAKQQDAVDRLYNYDETVLVAAMGAGKTVICQTAVKELQALGTLHKVIVACPARVVSVWPKEQGKWEHLEELYVVSLVGDPKQRLALLEQHPQADIIVISLNNLDWLLNQKHGCDGIIVDELSKAAGKQARGLKNKRKADKLWWRVGMTGTPVAQDLQKIFPMCRIINKKGDLLGTSKQRYLDEYFDSDYMGYNFTLRAGADKLILEKVKDLVHIVEDTKADDLPAIHYHVARFDMPHQTRDKYNEMKEEMVVDDVEAANEAVKSGKLRCLASGFVYDIDGVAVRYDIKRAEALMDWIDTHPTKKLIIFYEYVEQLAVLRGTLPNNYTTGLDRFKNEKPILLAQINSLSHGIDGLQNYCHDMIFFHPIWSRDASQQAAARVWRTGQEHEVNVTTLVCDDTLDDLVMDRVEDRAIWMKLFNKHLKN